MTYKYSADGRCCRFFYTEKGKCCKCCGRHAVYVVLNIVAACLHLVNAVVTLIIGDDKLYPIYETYGSWNPYNGTCTSGTYIVGNGTNKFVVNPRDKKHTYTLSLLWLIFFFHLLSFLFQFGVALKCFGYDYVNKVKRGVNPMRFVEYSISATLMLVCIALVSGIDEHYAIIGIVVLTLITMLLGLVSESLFDDNLMGVSDKSDEGAESKADSDTDSKYSKKQKSVFTRSLRNASEFDSEGANTDTIKKAATIATYVAKRSSASFSRKIGWIVHMMGWVTLMAVYGGIILRNFYFSVGLSDAKPPEWVSFALLSVFALYNVFGVTQFMQLCCKFPLHMCRSDENCDPQQGYDGSNGLNVAVEYVYVVNSLVTKTLLGYLIIFNLVIEDRRVMCSI
jgi:hypothetical protein